MALSTNCLTPGARFDTHICDSDVRIHLHLPMKLELSEFDADQLERNIHNALELVLAPFFDLKAIEELQAARYKRNNR